MEERRERREKQEKQRNQEGTHKEKRERGEKRREKREERRKLRKERENGKEIPLVEEVRLPSPSGHPSEAHKYRAWEQRISAGRFSEPLCMVTQIGIKLPAPVNFMTSF